MVGAEGPAHVRDPGGDAAGRGHPPQLDLGALVVGEEELGAVARPRDGVVVEPVGRVHVHGNDLLGARRRVEEVDVGKVLVPVLVLRGAEQRNAAPVRRPGRREAEVIRRHGAVREPGGRSGTVGRNGPDVLVARPATVERDRAPVRRRPRGTFVLRVAGHARRLARPGGHPPQIPVAREDDPRAVGKPDRRRALHPRRGVGTPVHRGQEDAREIRRARADRHPRAVRRNRHLASAPVAGEDVLPAEREGVGLAIVSRPRTGGRQGKDEEKHSRECDSVPHGGSPGVGAGSPWGWRRVSRVGWPGR